MKIQEQIEHLREELRQHNYNYYVLDNPVISDFEFDQKLKELEKLEEEHPEFYDDNSPTQRVGGQVVKTFNTVTHKERMYSLSNSYSKDDLEDWVKRIRKTIEGDLEFTCELKYDGASINLTYENNKFVRAVTRGDGFQGDDVSHNVRTIKSLPLVIKGEHLPENFDVRAEIVLPFEGFMKMNEERMSEGLEPYANPRNTASGSLKLQDSSEVSKRPLECLIYGISANNVEQETHFDVLSILRQNKFNVPKEVKRCKTVKRF